VLNEFEGWLVDLSPLLISFDKCFRWVYPGEGPLWVMSLSIVHWCTLIEIPGHTKISIISEGYFSVHQSIKQSNLVLFPQISDNWNLASK
jgi:hypothetical protein